MTASEAVEAIRDLHKVPSDAVFHQRYWCEAEDGRRVRTAVQMLSPSQQAEFEWTMPAPTKNLGWWYCIETPTRPRANYPVFLSDQAAREWVWKVAE